MRNIRSGLLVGLLLSAWGAPSVAAPDSLPVMGSVSAQRLIELPTPLSLRLTPSEAISIDQDLIDKLILALREQGVAVREGSANVLYLQRNTNPKPVRGTRTAVTVVVEGGSSGESRTQISAVTTPGAKPVTSAAPYGFDGRLEGPAGAIYWRFKVISHAAPGVTRLSDFELLRQSLAVIGQNAERDIVAALPAQ